MHTNVLRPGWRAFRDLGNTPSRAPAGNRFPASQEQLRSGETLNHPNPWRPGVRTHWGWRFGVAWGAWSLLRFNVPAPEFSAKHPDLVDGIGLKRREPRAVR